MGTLGASWHLFLYFPCSLMCLLHFRTVTIDTWIKWCCVTGEGLKIFSRPCPVRRHRWAQTLNTHSGGQSRGMREWGWGWGAGSPAAPRAPSREAALSEAGARWPGAPAQRAVGRRASLPLVSLACGRGASWVSLAGFLPSGRRRLVADCRSAWLPRPREA